MYKRLLSNAQRFKGPSLGKFRPLSTKTEFKCRTIKVNKQKLFMRCTYSTKILAHLLPFVSLSYETQFKFVSINSS